ncbi:MAG: hypothetical protein ACYDEJ_03255 [Desulfitobacteriaceae bacterium]
MVRKSLLDKKTTAIAEAAGKGVVNGKLPLDTTEIGMFGHHLYSLAPGNAFKTVYAGTPVNDDGSNGTVYMPNIGARSWKVAHGNTGDDPEVVGVFGTTWTGANFDWNFIPIHGAMCHGMRFKTGSTAAGAPVVFTLHRGHDMTGPLVITKTYPASTFPVNSTIDLDFGLAIDCAESAEYHGILDSATNFSLITNADNSLPWRAVDRQLEEHLALLHAELVFPAIQQTSPAADATAVVLAPTMTGAKGAYVANKSLDYDIVKTQVQIKRDADQITVSDRTLDGDVSIPTIVSLAGASPHHWRIRHWITKDTKLVPLPWSGWRKFTTTLVVTVNINGSTTRNGQTLNLASGDLVELIVAESVNSALPYNFHLSGQTVAFPPAAYDSGGLRFRDSIGTDLNFMVYTVTGSSPNRKAQVFIEVNAQVISDKKIIVTEVA